MIGCDDCVKWDVIMKSIYSFFYFVWNHGWCSIAYMPQTRRHIHSLLFNDIFFFCTSERGICMSAFQWTTLCVQLYVIFFLLLPLSTKLVISLWNHSFRIVYRPKIHLISFYYNIINKMRMNESVLFEIVFNIFLCTLFNILFVFPLGFLLVTPSPPPISNKSKWCME